VTTTILFSSFRECTTPPFRSMALEELNRAFVLFGRSARFERPEIAAPTRLWIGLPGVEAVPA
jgi:hypothetical protein